MFKKLMEKMASKLKPMTRMSEYQYEKSSIDKKLDSKKWAPKEWSKTDKKIDKVMLKKINSKKSKY